MQEIVTSHIFLAVFFHSTNVAMQFCLITGSGVVIPPKVLLFLANQILQAIAMSLLVSARLGDDNAVFISICGIVGNCNRVQNWFACRHLNNLWCIILTLSALVWAYSFYHDIHVVLIHVTQRKFGCVPILFCCSIFFIPNKPPSVSAGHTQVPMLPYRYRQSQDTVSKV